MSYQVLAVAGVTFLAAAVEWVEALTIVLAAGLERGWRSALAGTGVAFVALAALVAVFGAAITLALPLADIRTVIGALLLLFGLGWLKKAILRSSGLRSLHDEAAAFASTRARLEAAPAGARPGLDAGGFATAFNGVFLEGVEVVFIVVALGGLHQLPAATAGALLAGAVVLAVGLALRQPLTRVPENAIKYAVGIMLTTYGTFFAGEGIGVRWWRDDLFLLVLAAIYSALSLALVAWLRRRPAAATLPPGLRAVRGAAAEVWDLFAADGRLALGAVAVLLAVALLDRGAGIGLLGGLLLVAGVIGALALALGRERESP